MNNKLSREVVTAIMAGNEQQASKIFERAMAYSLQTQLEDYKAAVGAKMFESVDEIGGEFMPVKRDFTIHAIDPSKKSERFPEGEPVQYKTNSYSPRTAYKNAVSHGHIVSKVVDPVGNEVTNDAKVGLNESMRIVSKHGEGEKHTAKVYKDTDWGEYRVKFFKDGKHVGEDADYHTDDLDDAKDTAESQLTRYKSSAGIKESIDDVIKVADYIKNDKNGARNLNDASHVIDNDTMKKNYQETSKYDRVNKSDTSAYSAISHANSLNKTSGSLQGTNVNVSNQIEDTKNKIVEDTAVGNLDAKLTAQRRAEKDQEDTEKAQESAKAKAPTINDVVSVLGNTVSVADTSAAN